MHSPDADDGTSDPAADTSLAHPRSRVAIPLTPLVAVPLIRAALEQGRAMRRKALVRDVVARHTRGGNVLGAQSAERAVKAALRDMCGSGEVETVGFGTWALVGRAGDYRVPLTPRVAIPLIRQVLAGGRALKRTALAQEVALLHTEAGGAIGRQNALMVTKKALRFMLDDREVENAGFGRWSLSGQSTAHGVPLTPNVARQLIEAALDGGKILHRQELARLVAAQHKRTGGTIGASSPIQTVAQTLTNMASEGVTEHVSRGLWRLAVVDKEQPQQTQQSEQPPSSPEESIESDAQAQTPAEVVGDVIAITIEDEIGDGPEVIYVYFRENDRRLAQLEGKNVWDCKIGYSKTGDAIGRILEQGIKTSMSRLPTVGLVIRTHDSRELEKIVHSTLRLLGRHIRESPGAEWFVTSPAAIKRWYLKFVAGIEDLIRAD